MEGILESHQRLETATATLSSTPGPPSPLSTLAWGHHSATRQASALYGPPVQLPVDVGGHVEEFPVFVAGIADEGLFGADSSGTYRCYLSMSDNNVQLTLSNGATAPGSLTLLWLVIVDRFSPASSHGADD